MRDRCGDRNILERQIEALVRGRCRGGHQRWCGRDESEFEERVGPPVSLSKKKQGTLSSCDHPVAHSVDLVRSSLEAAGVDPPEAARHNACPISSRHGQPDSADANPVVTVFAPQPDFLQLRLIS